MDISRIVSYPIHAATAAWRCVQARWRSSGFLYCLGRGTVQVIEVVYVESDGDVIRAHRVSKDDAYGQQHTQEIRFKRRDGYWGWYYGPFYLVASHVDPAVVCPPQLCR